ncbi:zf-TFIIB domain-containing protein [Haloechinothrix salitolerans]
MRTVDKDGVHIEQCEGCGGIFLDRGEMEQIARAEAAFYGAAGGAGAAPPPYNPTGPGQPPPPRQHMPPPVTQTPGYGYSDSPKPYKGGYKDSPKPYRGGYRDSPKPYGHGHGQYGHRKRKGNFLENLFDF